MKIREFMKLEKHAKARFLNTKVNENVVDKRKEGCRIIIEKDLDFFCMFLTEVQQQIGSGKKHGAGKEIVEHLRANTDAKDSSQEFKISNSLTTVMVHLTLASFPEAFVEGQPFFVVRGDHEYQEASNV